MEQTVSADTVIKARVSEQLKAEWCAHAHQNGVRLHEHGKRLNLSLDSKRAGV
jgi:hypothetical protein